jgi:penicillin-binding protein 1B
MPTETDLPEQKLRENRRPPYWRRLLRIWQRRIERHRVLVVTIATIIAVPLLALLITGGWFYIHYSRLIDAQLQTGAFHDSVNIYGSPVVFSDGDALTTPEIEAELRLAGYNPGNAGQPNSFDESPKALDITPPDGPGASRVHIVMAGNREIQRIEQSGQDVKTWTAGYPLLENLSPGREKRHMVTFQELPPTLVNAIVSVEDKHFFHHRGLDIPRIIKAAYIDFRAGRKEQGASTLTMQLVRGLWLKPAKRWKRKIAEAMMTIHLERKWSKEEIMAAYANQVFLGTEAGYSIHGFAEGSQLFFGKEPGDLALPEAALLAGMVQRPSYFNPVRNPQRAVERRNIVLSLMLGNKYITSAEYGEAIDAPLRLVGPARHSDTLGAPWFLDLVGDELQSLDQPNDGAKNVYTTIDLNLQRAAAEAITTGMAEVDKLLAKRNGTTTAQAALIALDPHTGEIKALVGGRDYALSQLNRIFAKRPPGSVFKPFVYAAAMNTGIDGSSMVLTPSSTVNDDPTTFVFDRATYRPANFKHEAFGTMTLRQALAKSDNIAAVKVAQMVGYPAVVSMARLSGLNDDIKPTPAIALGSYAVTPFEMAGAYTAFANGGIWLKPRMVSYVRNADGETIHNEQTESHRAMDPRVAYLMTGMLEEVMRTGTAAGARSRGFTLPAAGKTGTSHDGWFAGYTSQLLCIVWVGFDDYRELGLEGAKSALPVWTEFMKKAAQLGGYRNAHEFPQPAGITSVKICLDSGQLAGDFCNNTATGVFISGTEPQVTCELHTLAPEAPELSVQPEDLTAPQPPIVKLPPAAPVPAPHIPPPSFE